MANITLGGNPITTIGELPAIGTKAPDFTLVKGDLSKASLAEFKGSRLVMNIFPSIDTGTCATSVRKFNEKAASLENTKVLCISRDTPFAMNRFCGAEGLADVMTLSDHKDGSFGRSYGLIITSGPLEGFLSRSVIVLDAEGNITYTEQVPDIKDEPDYEAALNSLENN